MLSKSDKVKIIIVGAGKAGELLLGDIQGNHDSAFEVIGLVDDDPKKIGKKISNSTVLGDIDQLADIVSENGIDELIIAIPSQRGATVRRVVSSTQGLDLVYKILPGLSEVLLQGYDMDFMQYVRRIGPQDLLGGEIAKSDQADIDQFASNQTIMITGAAGSIGSELSRQISAYGARKIIFYDWWENGIFDLRNQLLAKYPNGDFEFIIGDVKDRAKLKSIMALYKPDTVFHAAAYKHVPLMEDNPAEAIKNNIIGTKTVAELAILYRVGKFILISTDKAVNPTNIMGATKRAAEKMIHILSESQSHTVFCSVRFGNVINSNGSAIPIFEKQIEQGGPVTVTHRDITRYFMTIPEAVHLILRTWLMGENNDLFVLDMGEPVKIYDLARLLIILHGYIPDVDIKIQITGLRPGEKLYEEVLVKEELVLSTAVDKVFRTKNYLDFDKLAFLNNFLLLNEALNEDGLNKSALKAILQSMIPTYRPAEH